MKLSKDWYKSKTINAGMVLFLAGVYYLTGVAIEGVEIEQILLGITNIVGAITVIYGRYNASHAIKK